MKQLMYAQIDEQVYHDVLPNGLHVYLLPKQGFHKIYATFTTKYGSIDNHFVPRGHEQLMRVPDGVAHFLEHKMFEKEHDDVFQQFASTGGQPNAFTSFTRTAYLFSATSNALPNVTTLLDFVQSPYFTEQTVEKEKGIIAQEITMYDDNPNWRLHFGAIANMYHHHPVGIDIAGTVASIYEITKDDLYACYETFYHPSNMALVIIGAFDRDEMIAHIRANQAMKTFSPPAEVVRQTMDEPDTVRVAEATMAMSVQKPKVQLSYKQAGSVLGDGQVVKRDMALKIYFDCLFGRSSERYEYLQREQLIDDSFGFDYTEELTFGFASVSTDTNESTRFVEYMTEQLESGEGLERDDFERMKRKRLGLFVRSLNSLEFIANQFTKYVFNGQDLFATVELLQTLTYEETVAFARDLFRQERRTIMHVVPHEGAR